MCIYDAKRTHNTTAATTICENRLLKTVQFLWWTESNISKRVT